MQVRDELGDHLVDQDSSVVAGAFGIRTVLVAENQQEGARVGVVLQFVEDGDAIPSDADMLFESVVPGINEVLGDHFEAVN